MSEVETLHHALLPRETAMRSVVAATSRPAAPSQSTAVPDPIPVLLEETPTVTEDGLRVTLTAESRDNIQRAPSGARFFCVADTEGTTHCAVSRCRLDLSDAQKSSLGGERLEPIAPGFAGTGHQQVARAAGIAFDEETARVGYVDGDGFGLSIEKLSDCERHYSFRSAFNRGSSPDGGREMPAELAERFERGIERAFPTCGI